MPLTYIELGGSAFAVLLYWLLIQKQWFFGQNWLRWTGGGQNELTRRLDALGSKLHRITVVAARTEPAKPSGPFEVDG
jgi:hypothetical protein